MEYMDSIVKEFVKNGKNAQEVLDMPFHYLINILEEENKPKEVNSFFDIF